MSKLWSFGRNQTFAMAVFAACFIAACVKIGDPAVFASFVTWFAPATVLAVLAPSAYIKAAARRLEKHDVEAR